MAGQDDDQFLAKHVADEATGNYSPEETARRVEAAIRGAFSLPPMPDPRPIKRKAKGALRKVPTSSPRKKAGVAD